MDAIGQFVAHMEASRWIKDKHLQQQQQ